MPRVVPQRRLALQQVHGPQHQLAAPGGVAAEGLGGPERVRREHALLRIGLVGDVGQALGRGEHPRHVVEPVADEDQRVQRPDPQQPRALPGGLLLELGRPGDRSAELLDLPERVQHPGAGRAGRSLPSARWPSARARSVSPARNASSTASASQPAARSGSLLRRGRALERGRGGGEAAAGAHRRGDRGKLLGERVVAAGRRRGCLEGPLRPGGQRGGQRPVRVAPLRRGRHRPRRRAQQRMAERQPATAGDEHAPGLGLVQGRPRRRGRPPAARRPPAPRPRRGWPPAAAPSATPPGSARPAAARSRVPAGRRPEGVPAAARRPPAAPGSAGRPSPASPAGCRRSRPAAGRRRRGATPSRSSSDSPAVSPPTASRSTPSAATGSGTSARAANSMPTASAESRRAAKSSACADSRSTHCRSSTSTSTGPRSAARASSINVPAPTRKRSPAASASPQPSAAASAAAGRAGRSVWRSRSGPSSSSRAAWSRPASDSTPRARRTVVPSSARSAAAASSVLLPNPAAPSRRIAPLRPAAGRVQQRTDPAQLRPPADHHGRTLAALRIGDLPDATEGTRRRP